MNSTPLVSINIITYNSAEFVLDALESAKNQTYGNIELIISDDCSKDNTVQICKAWIDDNKGRFINTALITVEKNTGISANCNRALNASKGEWIKQCAGDDALFPNCIEDFISFINEHVEAKWVLGKFEEYKDSFLEENKVEYHKNYNNPIKYHTAKEQFKDRMDGGFHILPIALMMNVEALRSVGGFDEKYKYQEDFPLQLKLLRAGYPCFELDKLVGKYRSNSSSVFGDKRVLFKFNFKKDQYQVLKDLCFPYYSKRVRVRCTMHYYCCAIMNFFGLTRRTPVNSAIWKFLRGLSALLTLDFEILFGTSK